jgi:hypothetical protein
MPSDESASRGNNVRDPRHRADCADLVCAPDQDAWIGLRCPREVTNALEQAAEEAGRTWNDQLLYVIDMCSGHQPPSFDDTRTAEDWRTLMAQMQMQFDEGGQWFPFSYLFNAEQR